MGTNLTYKILEKHRLSGELVPGKEIGIRIDQTLTQDATGTMAYLQFEAMDVPRVRTELSVSYVDHNTLQIGCENADDHAYLQSIAAKYGIKFSRPGNGICHQVHLERFAKPGKTLLGSDSHTPAAGAMGMLAVGAGGLDVAAAMAGEAFYLTAPQVIRVELTGKLRPWVCAKDVILYILSLLSTKGNVNNVLEYAGEGLKTLSVPQRATIANMGAETGVTTSIFPSDELTRSFLRAQGREQDWSGLAADKDAAYARIISVDLSAVVPLAALPHSPGNVVPVKEISGTKVDQVEIGSCTNSSLEDLMITGKILAGKKVHPRVSLAISPGSRQVFAMIAKNGTLAAMIDAGARIMESACGFCIGLGQSPKTAAVSVRTSNRNFEGRSGTQSAGVYLVSPVTAALAAIHGEFIDPLPLPAPEYPRITLPEKFEIDDGMILEPPPHPETVVIERGPGIGLPPRNRAPADTLAGVIAIKLADAVTTDHIMPAGARLKYRSNVQKYAQFVFENIDADFSRRAQELRDEGKAVFILAGESYGQGSSREHAALCPMFLGVRAVIAKSFERIHAANLVNFGILPLIFNDPNDYALMQTGDALEIRDVFFGLEAGTPLEAADKSRKQKIILKYELTGRQKAILKAGGLLNFTRFR